MANDTWLRMFCRAALGPLVGRLPDPKHPLIVRMTLGLGAAVCFASGDSAIGAWGAGLFVLAMAVDRARPDDPEGKLVRLSLRTDSMVNVLVFAGVGFGLRHGPLGTEAIAMGLTAGFAAAAVLLIARRLDATTWPGRAGRSAFSGIETDDLMLAVPVMIWLGQPETMLTWASFLLPALAIGLAIAYIIRQRRSG
ncbi:MAG: hypothetical protein RIC16_00345 [Rhodospirillales bacterium]